MRAALRIRRLRLVALVLGASVVVSGCRTGSPLHNRYNDFRAYYNAYYNASRVMDEGERQLERPDQVVDRTRLVPIFPEGSGARGTQFQEAIDKSSDLLRERATSKWADDALFLIGKAYFYQGNVVGAELKFRETIQLAESRGNGRLADESRMWLGRTLGLAERYDEGAALLQERLALAEGNRRDQARLRLVLGELFARAGRYDEAAASLREGVPDEPDDDTAARGLLLLGQVEELRGEFIAAAEAYREATDRRPAYEIGYAADISRALVLGLDAGRVEDALDLIRRMRRDDKNYQHRAEVELAYGRILSVAGQGREGREAMRSVLYDPLLQGGSLRGEAHVRLAEFYRDIRNDFVQASAHLDTAATSIRQSGASTDQNLARAALTDVPRTASAFNAYATVAVRLAEADSLLELGMLDDEAFAARIREIEAQRLEVYRQEQRRLEQTRTQQEFAGGGQSAFREGSATQRSPNNRAPGVAPSSVGGTEVGFLSYRDQASVQANLLAFQRTWGERPLVPNWRRQAAIDASTVTAEDGQGIDPERLGRGAASSGPPPLDLSPIPRTPEAQIALRAERASLRYEAANALFLSLARPDSAATLYTLALEDGGPPEVSRQIRFALAEVETSRGRTEAAEALYRQIIEDAPETELADAARLRLGLDVATPDAEAAEPTSLAYEQARLRWTEGAYATAVGDFLALAADTSRADEAPRALLAAATAYIEWAHRDSFDVRRPLPESVIPPGLFPEPEAPGPEAVTPETPAPPVPTEADAPGEASTDVSPRIGAFPEEREAAAPARTDARPEESLPSEGLSGEPRPPDDPERLPEERLPEELLGETFDTEPTEAEIAALRRAMESGSPEGTPAEAAPASVEADETDPAEAALDSRRPAFIPPSPPSMAEVAAPEVGSTEAVATEGTPPDPSADGAVPDAPMALPASVPATPLTSADSLVSTDSLALADSLDAPAPPEPSGPTVEDVLVLLEQVAPRTPFATRAAAMRAALAPPPPEAEAADAEPAAEIAEGQYGLDGDLPIDPALGGFAWRAQRIPSALMLASLLRTLNGRGIRAAAIADGDGYRLILGQFASRPDAFAVRGDLPDEVQAAQASIIPLDGLTLLQPGDIERLEE